MDVVLLSFEEQRDGRSNNPGKEMKQGSSIIRPGNQYPVFLKIEFHLRKELKIIKEKKQNGYSPTLHKKTKEEKAIKQDNIALIKQRRQ